ncbi:type VII secretion system-associated protein [Saccharopolyspora sp. HNM0983]|uniref:Type VII secretion system-associated protein n=1 Tax=Saccharopolyspora montiporae TaxID=2781240 RepID=A0A929B952_9PSEU|nr:type VII secretion system-associated protein [Saccharopolyspora sp. HNM0983]MBE9374551.1 type VII secretion system-associated protein [Saccharopolyspora sp. HNM0983]
MNTQQSSRPVVTPAMREQATKQPNSWLYVVDPIFTDPNAEVPPWGFIGGYRVDEKGAVTDDFSPNPNYRPSPVALRLPAPTNDVERALQLTTTGYAQGHTLLGAMLDAELILHAQPSNGALITGEHESGRRQLQVFTSDSFLPPNWSSWQRLTGRKLAGLGLQGVDIQVNPTSQIKVRLPGEDLVRAAAAAAPKALGAAPAAAPAVPQQPRVEPPKAPVAVEPTPAAPEPETGGDTKTFAPPAVSIDARPASGEAPAEAPADPTGTPAEPAETPAEPHAPADEDADGDVLDTDFGQRFLGSVLAGAVGDALGAPVEFYPVDQIRSRFGSAGVTEYDRSGEHPGEFTDDTQLAAFTLEGLIRGHGAERDGHGGPLAAVQLAYQRWLHTQGYAWSRVAGPFAEHEPEPTGWLIGRSELFAVRSPSAACISALREFASVGVPGTFDRPINEAQDCSGVVRAAPVALWSEDPREVFELAAATAALTCAHPAGYLPAGVHAFLVHRLLRGEELPDAVKRARELLTAFAGHEETDAALQAAVDLASRGRPTPEQLKDELGGGWSGHEALAVAVCAALSTDGIAPAVMLAVNHSGNSDSTGALCGNLVGAQHGASSVPGLWLRDLKQHALLRELAADGLREFGPEPPATARWRARYPVAGAAAGLDFTSTLPLVEPDDPVDEDDAAQPVAAAVPQAPQDIGAADPQDFSTGTQFTAPQTGSEESDGDPLAGAESVELPAAADLDAAGAAELVGQENAAALRDPDDPVQRRVLGLLLGGAVGDALGYPVEDASLEQIRAEHGPDGVTGPTGPHPGSISDETQMTLFTLDGLIRANIRRRLHGENEPGAQVQQAYQRWLHTQGFDWRDSGGPLAGAQPDGWLIRQKGLFVRRAPGTTCIQALHGYAAGTPRASFSNRLNESKGCGGVMRAAPAGLWSGDCAEVFQVGALTAVLTHGHPSGYLPAGALAVLVHQLLADRSLPEAVDRALTELSEWDGHEETSTALRQAIDLATAGTPTPEQIQERLGVGGYGEQALAIAVCAALTHPESFADAVLLAANHSGDSDSSAAICGNIMGAAHTSAAIPADWRAGLELHEVIEQLALDAVREFGPEPPDDAEWLERYPVGDPEPPAPADVPDEPQPAAADGSPIEEDGVEPHPAPESEPPSAAPDAAQDEGLSDEELQLLTAWRRFRDNEEGSPELTHGLRNLLVEAFGAERAAQLVGEAVEPAEEPAELAAEQQVQLSSQERLAGCALGTAAGDALGAPWVFTGLAEIRQQHPDGLTEPDELLGRRGAATAAAQQSVFVLDGLLRAQARSAARGIPVHRQGLVQATLQHWLLTQGAPLQPVLPAGELAAEQVLQVQRFPDSATVSATARWQGGAAPTPADPPNAADSPEAAVRSAVVGLHADSTATALEAGVELGVLTHGHPDGYLPAGAVAGMVAALHDGRTLVEAVHAVLAELDQLEGAGTTARCLRAALEAGAGGPAAPEDLEELGDGWRAPQALGIAVAAALSHPNSFRDAVVLAATHSGNSAATAALCGALLGTARGTGAIPQDWAECLELGPLLEGLVADAGRIGSEIAPHESAPEWAQRYLG